MSVVNLDSFFQHSRPQPKPHFSSAEIRDRDSLFSATIFPATSVEQAKTCIKHLKNVIHGAKPASHEMAAWRCMILKDGCTGLSGPDDFSLQTGYEDDGEQWAGGRILKVMKNEAVIDGVVIVSRYFGGQLLGPIRFEHIEKCAQEVCRSFKQQEELQDLITTIGILEDLLDQLRSELAALKPVDDEPTPRKTLKKLDYSTWTISDIPKVKRLVTARENSIATVKRLISKQREEAKQET